MLRRGPGGTVIGPDEELPAGLGDMPPPVQSRSPDPAPEGFQTEFSFTLPRGYVDASGTVHRQGRMRLATARDELLPLADDRVRDNPPYLTVVLLSRVITQLGSLDDEAVNARVIEHLFAADLAFLQDLYRRVNSEGTTRAVVTCPSCNEQIAVDLAGGRLGES